MLSALQIYALNNEIKQEQITHGPFELSLIPISLLLYFLLSEPQLSP